MNKPRIDAIKAAIEYLHNKGEINFDLHYYPEDVQNIIDFLIDEKQMGC
jgi:hypothetical protein